MQYSYEFIVDETRQIYGQCLTRNLEQLKILFI